MAQMEINGKDVQVTLEKCHNSIFLLVDDWLVFELTERGTGRLTGLIDKRSHLKVDSIGRIIID